MGEELTAPSCELSGGSAKTGGVFAEGRNELDTEEGESCGIDWRKKVCLNSIGSGEGRKR